MFGRYRQTCSSSCRLCLTPATISVFFSVSSHQFRRLCLALSFIFRFICLSGPVCFSPSGRSYWLFLVMRPTAAALADDLSSSIIPVVFDSVVLPLRPSSISVASSGLPSLSRFRPSSSCRCLASSPSGCRHCLPVRVCISISVSGHHCSAAYPSLLRFCRCSGAFVPVPFGHSDCSSVALRPVQVRSGWFSGSQFGCYPATPISGYSSRLPLRSLLLFSSFPLVGLCLADSIFVQCLSDLISASSLFLSSVVEPSPSLQSLFGHSRRSGCCPTTLVALQPLSGYSSRFDS